MRSYDPELVLTDAEFREFDPTFDITGALLNSGSILGAATWPVPDSPVEISTSALIKRAITTSFLHSNPKDNVASTPYCSSQLILASLQREQGLLSLGSAQAAALKLIPKRVTTQLRRGYGDPATILPTDAFRTFWTTALSYRFDFCLGYGALDRPAPDKPFPPKWEWFRGFAKQVQAAARRYREMWLEWKNYGMAPIRPLDWEEQGKAGVIVPRNAATWALYMYTPRVEAAELTYKVFARNGWIKG
jgi:hypothetical protein